MGGDDASVFFGSIRSMVVLPSGRFAVADEHSAVVSVFDPDGQFVHRFGGRGEGPGEVGGIWDLYGCAGDTVVVRFRSELSFFGGDGEFIRRINSAGAGTTWSLEAVAPDCRNFIASRSAAGPTPPTGQEWLLRSVLVHTDDAFMVTDTVAQEVTGEGFTGSLRGEDIFVALPWNPFDANVELRRDHVIAGFGRWAEFRVHSLAGGLEQLIRWHATPDEVTAADHDRYMAKRSEFLARYEGSPDALFSFPSLREFPRVPTHKPFFDRFLVDDAGKHLGSPLSIDRARHPGPASAARPRPARDLDRPRFSGCLAGTGAPARWVRRPRGRERPVVRGSHGAARSPDRQGLSDLAPRLTARQPTTR